MTANDYAAKAESLTAESEVLFPEYENGVQDPLKTAGEWLAAATEYGVREPRSFSFATVAANGIITARILAALAIDSSGVEFATHSVSRKIIDATSTGAANALFYWKELGRQLSISGRIAECTRERSDEVWYARPAALDPMSVVSVQSSVLDDPEALRLKANFAKKPTGKLVRPDRFRVYHLIPKRIEFWSAASDRLHRRLVCDRTTTDWSVTRLQP